MWDFSKEAHNEKDLAYKQGRLKALRKSDPYQHLVTVHDDDKANDAGAYDALTDFRADQQHSNWHALIPRQRARRDWPVANVEFGYEHGPGGLEDKTYRVVQAPEEVVRRAWEIALAGGYTVYYYTYTAWDVIRPEDVPPGTPTSSTSATSPRHRVLASSSFRRLGQRRLVPGEPGPRIRRVSERSEAVRARSERRRRTAASRVVSPAHGPAHHRRSLRQRLGPSCSPANWGRAPVVLHLRAR